MNYQHNATEGSNKQYEYTHPVVFAQFKFWQYEQTTKRSYQIECQIGTVTSMYVSLVTDELDQTPTLEFVKVWLTANFTSKGVVFQFIEPDRVPEGQKVLYLMPSPEPGWKLHRNAERWKLVENRPVRVLVLHYNLDEKYFDKTNYLDAHTPEVVGRMRHYENRVLAVTDSLVKNLTEFFGLPTPSTLTRPKTVPTQPKRLPTQPKSVPTQPKTVPKPSAPKSSPTGGTRPTLPKAVPLPSSTTSPPKPSEEEKVLCQIQ